MEKSVVSLKAAANLFRMHGNTYPGRIIILGTSQDGKCAVQGYVIMGRGKDSRNRRFNNEEGRLFTEAANPAEMKDPSLIIYDAMAETNGYFIVSNGDQTGTVASVLSVAKTDLTSALMERTFEPDPPRTPRITGCHFIENGQVYLSVLSILRRAEMPGEDSCERFSFQYDTITPGFGMCISTYDGDGNPLPSFSGVPYIMPLYGDIIDVSSLYWEALNPDNKVALAVKFIEIATGKSEIKIINKYTKVEPKV